jgi:hypothetical protein
MGDGKGAAGRNEFSVIFSWAVAFVQRIYKLRHFASVVIMIGAVLSGLAGAAEGPLLVQFDGAWLPTRKLLLLLAGLGLGFFGAGFNFLTERDATPVLTAARQLSRRIDEERQLGVRLAGSVAAAATLDIQRMALISAYYSMREAVETCLCDPAMNENDAVPLMLRSAEFYLKNALVSDQSELFEFSISRVVKLDDGTEGLRMIAVSRPIQSAELANSRVWLRKEGFIGAAWDGSRDVVVPDTSRDEIADIYPVPLAKQSVKDKEVFRSVAAIPVRIRGDEQIWGVVFGSSNRVERFRRIQDPGSEQGVATVRAIAGMTAVLAAGLRCRA